MGQSMSNAQIDELWAKKISQFSNLIDGLAKGNDDYFQEGILGLRRAVERNPDGPDGYFVKFAKYAMVHYRDKGKSVDNGVRRPQKNKLKSGEIKTYQKDMLAIYLNDPGESLELPAYTFPPDLLAIDRICAERFYGSLNDEESKFMDTCREVYASCGVCLIPKVIAKLKISENKYNRIRRDLKKKFIRIFGTDEQIRKLNYISSISPPALEI